jgi:hypothetical protein
MLEFSQVFCWFNFEVYLICLLPNPDNRQPSKHLVTIAMTLTRKSTFPLFIFLGYKRFEAHLLYYVLIFCRYQGEYIAWHPSGKKGHQNVTVVVCPSITKTQFVVVQLENRWQPRWFDSRFSYLKIEELMNQIDIYIY